MGDSTVRMPDGTQFAFWDDETRYDRVYHVAGVSAAAADDNPGTEERPFATIGRAAEVMRPGEKAVIHGGVYRECIRPARGGERPDRMIAYEAAPGEQVVVKGSRLWQAEFRPSEGWSIRDAGATVWMADLPAEWFAAYNPFALNNVFAHLCTFVPNWTKEELEKLQLRRGMIFADGRPLGQVVHPRELAARDGAFWVEDPGLRVHFRLPGDADPGQTALEAAVQEQLFVPRQRHLGYIRIRGIAFEHAADGVPVPQRAAVSTWRGHHWIIEDCLIRHANAVGLDIGDEDWRAAKHDPCGGHVVRRNRISHCGVCGLAGVGSVDGSLVEDNVIEHVGGRVSERLYECAAAKLHVARGVLIRRNVFRHTRDACGLWLDYLNENCRVTGNVFADVETLIAALYLEVSHAANTIDGNFFWDVRDAVAGREHGPGVLAGGFGVSADTGENCLVAHNFFGKVRDTYAVACHLNQRTRLVGGRAGLCRRNAVLNNVFAACPRRVYFAQAADNRADGNCYDVRNQAASFYVDAPTAAILDLSAWREFYGLDSGACEAAVEAEFDPASLTLRLKVRGEAPRCAPVPDLGEEAAALAPGPFTQDQWAQALTDRGLELQVLKTR